MPGKKLLVADDSLTIQKVIRLALSNEGYEIQAVADGNDAINQILLFRPDVVLIDVSLPSKNAFEVKREVNAHEDLQEIRFVLISSAFEKVDESQVEEVEFHERLTKPFDPAHLRKILSSVLDQVVAKRHEPTAFLSRPLPSESLILMDSSESDELPPLPMEPPPLPGEEYSPGEDDDQPNLPIPPKMKANPFKPSMDFPELPPLLPEEEDVLPPLPSVSDSTNENDIQRLTESTMRISGMDDYQWSMNEPSLRPSPLMRDTGGTDFNLNSDLDNLQDSSPSRLLPPPPPLSEESSLIDLPPTGLPFFETSEEQVTTSYSSESDLDSRSPILASEEKIDAMIHNQIEATLEKMIEKLLPQIAEKLIKEEIHRLLSE